MPKKQKTETLPPDSAGKTGAQRFEYREINRNQINPAPYNPRAISDYARKQLRSSLDRFGLVETLVWNETTGNLVSGHQRLSLVDEREGWPEKVADYRIGVSVIRLSLKREKELNVWLNNASAQGHYEKDSFLDLIQSDDFTLDDFGFTKADLEFEFGALDGELNGIFESQKRATAEVVDEAEKIAAIKARKKQVREEAKADPSEDTGYYVVVVWDSTAAKEQWLRAHRLPHDVTHLDIARLEAAVMGAAGGSIPGRGDPRIGTIPAA